MPGFANVQNDSSSMKFSADIAAQRSASPLKFTSFFSGTRVASAETRRMLGVADHSVILALNETRKTLLASRLMIADRSKRLSDALTAKILPGDGVWIEACNRVDTSGMRVALDLLFLDSDSRVLAAVTDVRPGSACPEVEKAVGVLELAAGTIQLSQTEKGDRVVLEPIVPPPSNELGNARASRS
jgi:uncharacterized protein DUF192 probably involved in sugar metabolism